MKQLPRIVLKGDRQAAEEMIREGVRQFDILLQQMKFAGLKQDVRRVRYLDGSEIVCKSVFGDNTLEIYVPPEVKEEEKEFPPRGDFIVFYKEHDVLMSVREGELKMVPVRDVQRPPMSWLNTSIALTDRVVDVIYQHGQSNDPGFFGYSGYSEWSKESVCVRSGNKVCLETEVNYSFTVFSSLYVPLSYAVWHSADWSVVCVAQMTNTQVAGKWTYIICASRYVWDRGEFKLVDRVEEQLQCDEEKYPSGAYPTYILRIDDEQGVLYNVGWYIVSEDRHVYEKRRLDILSGEDTLVTTYGSSYTSAAVHRHHLAVDGVVLVESDTIEKHEEDASGDWWTWQVDGDFLHLGGRSRSDYPECNTEHFNGYRYEFEWDIDDYTLGGFRIVEDIDFREFWQECLRRLNPEEYIPWKRVYRLWFKGDYSLGYEHKLKWPDGKDMTEFSGPTPCWHALVNKENYVDCSGHVEWEWTGALEDIDGYSFWIEGVPGRGGALMRHPVTQIPYRRLALLAGASLPVKPYAFFAKNGSVVVKMLIEGKRENGDIHYDKMSVLVNDLDRTEDFLKEFERVTGETFDPSVAGQYTIGLFAYVGGKNEQGLPG